MRPRHHTAENMEVVIVVKTKPDSFNEAAASHRGKHCKKCQ